MDLKSPCQKCGQNIAFEESARGQRIDCPHCGWPTVLGAPAPAVVAASASGQPVAAPTSGDVLSGGVLIVAGVVGFFWFAFGYDATVSSGTSLGNVNNVGRLATQIGGFIASATAVLSGFLLLILARLRP